jgi:hypothetical protein
VTRRIETPGIGKTTFIEMSQTGCRIAQRAFVVGMSRTER